MRTLNDLSVNTSVVQALSKRSQKTAQPKMLEFDRLSPEMKKLSSDLRHLPFDVRAFFRIIKLIDWPRRSRKKTFTASAVAEVLRLNFSEIERQELRHQLAQHVNMLRSAVEKPELFIRHFNKHDVMRDDFSRCFEN